MADQDPTSKGDDSDSSGTPEKSIPGNDNEAGDSNGGDDGRGGGAAEAWD